MEEQLPVAQEFKGMQKRVAPHALPPGYSPDCQNCRPYLGMLGRLGPRKGRTKTSSTAFAGAVMGFYPSEGGNVGAGGGSGGTLFVAIDDGITITISPEPPLFNGGGAWAGPTLTTINMGFTYTWDGPSGVGASAVVPNIAINGANRCIATCPSGSFETYGVLRVTLTFDVGDAVVNYIDAEATSGCCATLLNVDEVPTLYTIPAGATKLTGILAEAIGDGSQELSGKIIVVGCRV